MVYQEVWSNAAVGQQERRAWWGQNRRERTAGRTVIPTPAPGLLIQPPQLRNHHFNGSWSHDADGRSHRCVNFSFISNRGSRDQLCVGFAAQQADLFFFFFFTSRKKNCRSKRIVSFPRSCAEGGTLRSKSSSEAQNAGDAAVTSREFWDLRGASRTDKVPFQR